MIKQTGLIARVASWSAPDLTAPILLQTTWIEWAEFATIKRWAKPSVITGIILKSDILFYSIPVALQSRSARLLPRLLPLHVLRVAAGLSARGDAHPAPV
jgi:hypothetical protein